jgi:hypothetical protein
VGTSCAQLLHYVREKGTITFMLETILILNQLRKR